MELEIRHLQLVRAVAQRGTLTSAGLVLHLSQSALSHQLLDIESRLGTPLFLRVGKRLALTPAGERLLASANEVLATIVQTEDAIRQLVRGQPGRAAHHDRMLHVLPLAAADVEAVSPHASSRRRPNRRHRHERADRRAARGAARPRDRERPRARPARRHAAAVRRRAGGRDDARPSALRPKPSSRPGTSPARRS